MAYPKRGVGSFSEEKRGAGTIFLRKKRGQGIFLRVKKGGNNFFQPNKKGAKSFFHTPKIPKTRPGCPVNFGSSLILFALTIDTVSLPSNFQCDDNISSFRFKSERIRPQLLIYHRSELIDDEIDTLINW